MVINDTTGSTAARPPINQSECEWERPASEHRMLKLEAENRRLLLLVAELLIKNQELRKGHCPEA